MILAPPVVDSSQIKIQVLHFSGDIVTRGLLADVEPAREDFTVWANRTTSSSTTSRTGRCRPSVAY